MKDQIEEIQSTTSEEPIGETSENSISQSNVGEDDIDTSKPVYNSDDAKKVLEKVKNQNNSQKDKIVEKGTSNPKKAETIDYAKQYSELQKLVGRQSKEMGELRKFQQENGPVIESYRKFLANKEQENLQAQYGQDPMAVIREIARREAMESVAPYQQQIVIAEASNIHNWIKENSGGEYEALAPVMADVLEEFQEMDNAQGGNYAQSLAKNPNILMQLAAGRVHLNTREQTSQQLNQVQQKKAQNLKIANGVAKSSNNQSATPTDFKNQSLQDMTAQLRNMGIVK